MFRDRGSCVSLLVYSFLYIDPGLILLKVSPLDLQETAVTYAFSQTGLRPSELTLGNVSTYQLVTENSKLRN